MAYKEPGVYLRLITNPKYATGYTPSLIPMIMGSGAKVLSATSVVTRAISGNTDILPRKVVKVLSVGRTTRKPDFFETDPAEPPTTKDFKLVDSIGELSAIEWETEGSSPEPGDNYYVTYTYEVSDEQFEPRLIFSAEEIEKYYGPEFREHEVADGFAPINRLSLAGKIALEAGAPVIYMLQVPENTSTKKVTAVEYQTALDNHVRFLEDVWRIVPVDLDKSINNAIDMHIEACSSYEERKERTAIYGTPHTSKPTDFNEVYNSVGDYAASKNYKRVTTFYPDEATKLLSDGNYHDLDAPFLAAGFAGREAFLPVYRSKTRDEMKMFDSLKGVKMLRKQMNMLAEKGVTILTQPYGPGTSIVNRHQLTTEMISPQTRENSIVMIGDFASKYLRQVCEQYIGKYNITGETIARIQATLDGALYQLKKEGIITSGSITSIMQDEYNPDTLLVSVIIKPPYPCNYIDITLFLD